MPEITAAELRKLRALETRVVTVNDTLTEVRAKRDEFKAELTATRRELRDVRRSDTEAAKQIDELVAENARLAGELANARGDLATVNDQAVTLRTRVDELSERVKTATAESSSAKKAATAAERARARIEKQLATANDKLAGNEPPELTPDQLSSLLGGFIETVGGQTGLDIAASRVNLRVGFSGRGGGAFVVPSLGVDSSKLPELHDVTFDLTRRPDAGLVTDG